MKEMKKQVLKQLKKLMFDDDDMGMDEFIKDKKMKKVTVASDSGKGLKEGLEKASSLLEDDEMEDEEDECTGKKGKKLKELFGE